MAPPRYEAFVVTVTVTTNQLLDFLFKPKHEMKGQKSTQMEAHMEKGLQIARTKLSSIKILSYEAFL